MARLTDREKIIAHLAYGLADAYNRGYTDDNLDDAITHGIERGYSDIDITLGGESPGNWTRIATFHIAEDEADLFRAAVKVAVEELQSGGAGRIEGTRKLLDAARTRLTA